MSDLRVTNLKGRTAGNAPNLPDGAVVTGVITATTFSGSLSGNATGLSGTPNITVGNITGVAATFTGNVSIAGTLTYEDVTNVDSVGLVTARTGIEVTGIITARAGTAVTFTGGVDISNAVETVSTASTSSISGSNLVVIECNAQNGTVFTHNISSGSVGIVSLRNFPVTKNSVTTFTILFTQLSSTPVGNGNTTAASGIGTNITLTPLGVAGFTTSARVATASTITLSTTASDVDIVTLAIHYNGSGTGTVGNYRVFGTNNTGYRLGTIRP